MRQIEEDFMCVKFLFFSCWFFLFNHNQSFLDEVGIN